MGLRIKEIQDGAPRGPRLACGVDEVVWSTSVDDISHPARRRSALDQPEIQSGAERLSPHKDRSPRQETGVEGLSFWEGERYQHTRRGSLDSLGFQLDQQKRGLTRMKVSEDAPFRCGSPISLQNDSCLSAMSVIASASKHTVSCTHALNNLNVSDKCVAASGIPAIASAPFAGKRPQEKRSCLEG